MPDFATEYDEHELLAVLISRLVEDGDRICAGAHTEICFAGCMHAQKTHAPNLKLQLGGTCYLTNVVDQEVPELPSISTDYVIHNWAEEVHDHHETFHFFNPTENTDGERSNSYYIGDKFFVSGIEVDKMGNVNLIGIGDDGEFLMRGPGTVGICDIPTVREIIIFLTNHDERTLVEEVDFISCHGPNGYEEYGYPGDGPQCIVTPKAIFDFDDDSGEARLRAALPGSSVEDILESTGFDPIVPDEVADVDPPTEAELALLRSEVDPTEVLRSQVQ